MKQYLKWTMTVVLVTLLLPQISLSQSVKRQSIGSYGSNGFTNSAIIGQTIGQSYSTKTYTSTQISVAPGFQQPLSYVRTKTAEDLQLVSFKVYPNPASDNFALKSQESLEHKELKVSDINGRLLLLKQLPELTTYTINCSAWEAGMYFITVESQNKQYRYSTKLIITNH